MRLMEPIELPTTVTLFTAFGGIVTELIAFWLLFERQKQPQYEVRFLAHHSNLRRQPHHLRLGAGHPLHRLPRHRSHPWHGVRPRPVLGVVEHHPLGPTDLTAEHA